MSFSSNERGRLESNNVYVAEKLLIVAEDIDPTVFFQRFQAGFVVAQRDPPYSVCSCSDPSDTCHYISPLQQTDSSEQNCVSQYSLSKQCAYLWAGCIAGIDIFCSAIGDECENFGPDAGGSCNTFLPGCYVVEGLSANILGNVSCSHRMNAPPCSSDTVGATYPDQNEEIAVTVWYNNQVREFWGYIEGKGCLIGVSMSKPHTNVFYCNFSYIYILLSSVVRHSIYS